MANRIVARTASKFGVTSDHRRARLLTQEGHATSVSVGTLQYFCPVCGPLPISKEKVVHSLSCLVIYILICLGDIDSKDISIKSCHASAELDQHASFSVIISYIAVACVSLEVLYSLVWNVCLYSWAAYCWGLLGIA